ncbi:MAG: N-acetylglucosamine-6-phosphate deacetylase [Epulopiscium sp.]|nr:nagA [Defluviitaleaceae bacterium]MDK2788299.1 N-acetylglucosamine-6-phosphate deacetylase [Candidatus Epulonipiscium sp.]
MMKCLYNGKIILKDQVITGKAIIFDERIYDIVDENEVSMMDNLEKIDVKGKYISPGFIDIHIHGFDGYDTMDASEEALKAISKGITRNGVTSFLPTTMTMSKERIISALEAIRQFKEKGNDGAEIIGVNVEGPFINKKFKGAQDEQYIIPADFEIIKEYKDLISLITVAPETEGALEFIKKVKRETNIVLSMGHTAATYEEAKEGIISGISHVTHLFNAMTGLHHRNPGVVGAALTHDVTCEVIADTIHIHSGLFSMILKTKGMDKVVLVTDCMSAGGKEEGEYDLGGQKVFVKDKQARLADGTLAGSVLNLKDAVYNVNQHTDFTIHQLVSLITINPAKILGVDKRKGSLEIGKDADITVFDENMNISLTIGRGKILYEI